MRFVACLLFGILSLAPALAAGAQDELLDKTVDVHVPPQSVSTAVMELSRQAGVQLVMPGQRLDAYRTGGVHGRMSLRAALERLLGATAWKFRQTGDATIAVEPSEKP